MRRFGWRDGALALLVAVLLIAIGTVAHDKAEQAHPDGRFVGMLADSMHVSMGAVYGAFIRETMDAPERPEGVAGGSGLFVHNAQTTDPHRGKLIRPWEHFVGLIGRLVGPDDPAHFAYHAERWLAALLFCLGVAWLGAELFARFWLRAAFLVAAAFGGNLYWLVEALGRPAGLRSWIGPRWPGLSGLGFSYPSYLLGVPHLAMEIACAAAGFAGLLATLRLAGKRSSYVAALLGGLGIFGLASIRPYTSPVVFAVVGISLLAWVWAGRKAGQARLRSAAILLLCLLSFATPILIFDALALRGDSVFAALDVVHISPPPLEQALFMGAPLFAALLLLPLGWRSLKSWRGLVLVAWLLFGTALANGGPLVPWEVEALSPLVLAWLALFGLLAEGLLERPSAWARPLVLALVALVLGSGLWADRVRAGELEGLLEQRDRHLWMTDLEAHVVDLLAENRSPGSLSRDVPEPGVWIEPRPMTQFVPWLAGVRVFLGHPDHTPDSGPRRAFSERFRRDGQGLELLVGVGVTHLVSWPIQGPDPFDNNPKLERLLDEGIRVDRILLPAPNSDPIGD